ncbi:adenylate/guanylate cyclase domain-containing protein [Myxococcaceae bacterium GXIMD 01537]
MASETLKVLRLRLRGHLRLMLAVAVLSTVAAALGWSFDALRMSDAERTAYDLGLTTFRKAHEKSRDVVVVAIDQDSIDGIRANPQYARNFGTWPWSRNLWARVVEQLEYEGARAVVFDAVMDERATDPAGDLQFAQVLRDTRLPFYVGFSAMSATPLPRATPAPAAPVASAEETLPAEALPTEPPPAEEEEFVEVDSEEVYPPADPAEAARALAFPVRYSDGRSPLPLDPRATLAQNGEKFPTPPISPLLTAVDGFGLVNAEPDPDAVLRRTRFAYSDGNNTYVTLAVAVAADLYGASELEFSGRTLRLGQRTFAINADGSAEIDFGGTLYERHRVVRLLDVLDAAAHRAQGEPTGLEPDLFRGKVVVIGGTAVGLNDVKATPFKVESPGVAKQAAVIENLLAGRFITDSPFWVNLLLAFAVALLSAVLVMVPRWTPLEIGWPLLLPFAVFGVTGKVLGVSGVHMLTAMPVVAGELASLSAVAINRLFANREADFIRQAFSRFMEPKLVEQMISARQLPRLDGENFEMTAFFSDIRGFSTFSERFKQDPRALVRILNTYLTRVSAALLREGGCLDKYIGDAVVCLFGAPLRHEDHAVRACRGALAVKAEVDALRAEFRAQGLPDVYTRIGVNTAVNFVGNFGSEQLFAYTAMGDGMNLAARLEGANKAYGSVIMIGARTCELARDFIEVRELDRVRVAGKTEAVTVFELLALKGRLPEPQRVTVERYHEALALYRQARFAEAAAVLEAQAKVDPDDGPTQALLERCREYEKSPPEKFDGVANLEK